MKNIAVIYLLSILFAKSLEAQKAVVKISPEIKLAKSKMFQDHLVTDKEGAHYLYFYEYGGSGFMSTSLSVDNVIIEKYDPKFKEVYSKEFKSDRKGLETLGLKYFQGKFAWLYSEENKKEDWIKYGIIPIGLDGKQAKPVDIAKIKYETRRDLPSIVWDISKDSSKMLIRAISDNDDDDQDLGVFVSVLDQTYTPIWSKKTKIDHSEETIAILKSHLLNDGSVFLLAKVYEGKKAKESKKEKKKSVPNYDIMLFRITKDSDKPSEIKLNLGDSFIQGASLTSDAAGNLNCAGFYSNTRSGSIQGVFFLKLSPDGAVLAQSKKEFTVSDLKIIGKGNTKKDKTGDEGLESGFTFSDFLIKDDGSAVVISEENFSVTTSYYNPTTRSTTYRTTYHSHDIVFFSIKADGNIERVTVIPKYQVGSSSFFQSYVAMVNGQDVVFFYNEDEDNMGKPVVNPKPKPTGNFKDCVAVMTTLQPDGKLVRKQLFEAKDVESLFVPKNSTRFSNNQLFFVSQKFKMFGKSNFHIGTVTIP